MPSKKPNEFACSGSSPGLSHHSHRAKRKQPESGEHQLPSSSFLLSADAGKRYPLSALEKHYSIPEVAELWGLSTDKVRELFRDVPGVIKIGSPETRHKRGYITLRIPESVVQRVHSQLRGKAAA